MNGKIEPKTKDGATATGNLGAPAGVDMGCDVASFKNGSNQME